MSRFYGDLTGQAATTATRRGTAGSGVQSHVRGWNVGARVNAGPAEDYRSEPARDGLTIVLTGGSHGSRREVELAEITEAEDGAVRVSLLAFDGGRDVFYILRDGTRATRLSFEPTEPEGFNAAEDEVVS